MVNKTKNWVLWKKQKYTFDLQVQVDLLNYGGLVEPPEEIPVWYRLFFCQSPDVGFRHPFLDSPHWDSYYDASVNDNDFRYVEGTALRTLDTDPSIDNVTFRTTWIAGTLAREDETSLVYQGGVDMTIMAWDDMEDDRYYMVAHGTLEMRNSNGETLRLDMSNSLPGQPLAVSQPMECRESWKQTSDIRYLLLFFLPSFASIIRCSMSRRSKRLIKLALFLALF